MTSFANLDLINRVSIPKKATKPRVYDFGIRTEKQLDKFCKLFDLTDEEKTFLRLTEIEQYSMNQIGQTLGITRQCVSQKRRNLYRRTIERQSA